MPGDVHLLAEIAGTLAGILSIASFVPQLLRIHRRRSAGDVSLAMYVGLVVASALWVFYGYVRGAQALLVTNVLVAVIALLIMALKLRYADKAGD